MILSLVLFLLGLAARVCLALGIELPHVLFLLGLAVRVCLASVLNLPPIDAPPTDPLCPPGPAGLKLGSWGAHHDKGIRGGDSGGGRLHGEIRVCCAETVATPLPGTLLGRHRVSKNTEVFPYLF